MTTRRNLSGIADNLLSSFISRNNDFDGYRASGRLQTFADQAKSGSILLDLPGTSDVPEGAEPRAVATAFGRWLRVELVKSSLPPGRMREAE